MNTNKSIIKTCMKIIVLLLLIMSISNVSYAATYSGTSGVEAIVKSNPSDMINKDIFLKYSDLKESNYLYCLEQGQRMKESGSNYTISEYIEIDGEKATAMYKPSGKDWHYYNNENQYNAILALILNSEGQLGHGSSATNAQKALWSYFPYWIQKSGATLGTDNSWCSGSNWSAEYNGGSNSFVEKAIQAYANGERAKVKIYLLHNINGTESWQRLMIAIPEGKTIQKDNDLVIKKIDKDTGEPLAGVQFTVRSETKSFIQASGPDANNVYQFVGYTNDASKATKFKTGTNTYKDITIKSIPDDKYIIQEIYNPNLGYEVNNGNEYVVDKTNNNNDEPCIITIKNEKTEKLIIKKIDEDTQEPLSKVEFTLKNDENQYIKTTKPNSKNEYTFIGYTDVEAEATRFVTGKNEYIPITIMELPSDVYTIKEVSNPNRGYADDVGYECIIDKKDSATNEDIEITIKNTKTENFIIEKIDKNTGAKLGGVEFILWNDEKQFIQASGPDSDNVYTFTGYTQDGNEATRFITGTTNGYKPITIIDLPNDTYTLKEMYNPNITYEINELREWQMVKEDSKTNEDFVVIAENESGTEKYEHKPTTVMGKVTISGFVWEDVALGKDNTINNQYDENEERVEGIKVYWKDSNGEIIDSATTDANGYYEFAMELKFQNHPYKLIDQDKYDRINGSYVEFDYNGIKYTTVANTSKIEQENVSQGIEIESDRDALDNSFNKVENQQIIDNNGNVFETVDNLKDVQESNYLEKYAVTATTNKIKNMLTIAEGQEGWTKKTTFCTEHCEAGIRQHEIGTVELEKDGASATLILYCFGRAKIQFWNDPDGILNDEINAYLEAPVGEEINKYNANYYSAGEIDGPAKKDCESGEEHIYEWNIKNVNLGLVRREQPDLAITSDIEKVRVIMKDQEYTYIYGNRGIQDSDESFDYKVQFGNKYLETYSRPVNPADIAYVNLNNSDDLKVYVTYNIIAKNQSNTLYMTANNIVNYYDSNYTIYRGERTVTSEGWVETTETGNGYKVAYNNSLNSSKIAPGERTEILKIEFEVNQDTIKGLLNEDAPLKNISEIVSYSTYYGNETICAENKNAITKGKSKKQYAGIDIDSIPGNAIPGNTETYEDDTDQAPSFLLHKDNEETELKYKVISGTVWEDSQTDESKNNNERLGDGIKSDSERGIAKVKVELLEVDDDGKIKLDSDGNPVIAKLYKITDKDENGDGELDIKESDAITYTDSNGNYSFGNNSTDVREGVVTDKYIIKYTYGNDTINARNYKSTIITTSSLKEVMEGEVNNDKWYLTIPDNASIAVDDLNERLAIPSLQYSNFNDSISMTAYSKPFEVKIEFTEDSNAEVGIDGGEFEHDWTRFDFGIIERPREDIVVDKTVSYIRLTLANGQVLIEGDLRNDTLNYVKALGFKEAINNRQKSLSVLDKLLTLEVDTELIQGSTLNITYAITVTNNSEKDYEYDTNLGGNDKYYYYGEEPTKVINQSVELLVDYLDSELVCEAGENAKNEDNKKWTTVIDGQQITADYLKDNGYISFKKQEDEDNKTYETLKSGDYTILVTDEFKDLAPAGGTQTEYISVSKVLANNDDGNAFDNHVEILKLNGKIARTIDSTNNGEQIIKTYKPGNYIPSFATRVTNPDGTLEIAGLHQPDDNRVRVVVTPPTGISNYIIIYIIVAVIGLIVIVGGIIFIKKKIIIK